MIIFGCIFGGDMMLLSVSLEEQDFFFLLKNLCGAPTPTKPILNPPPWGS